MAEISRENEFKFGLYFEDELKIFNSEKFKDFLSSSKEIIKRRIVPFIKGHISKNKNIFPNLNLDIETAVEKLFEVYYRNFAICIAKLSAYRHIDVSLLGIFSNTEYYILIGDNIHSPSKVFSIEYTSCLFEQDFNLIENN